MSNIVSWLRLCVSWFLMILPSSGRCWAFVFVCCYVLRALHVDRTEEAEGVAGFIAFIESCFFGVNLAE